MVYCWDSGLLRIFGTGQASPRVLVLSLLLLFLLPVPTTASRHSPSSCVWRVVGMCVYVFYLRPGVISPGGSIHDNIENDLPLLSVWPPGDVLWEKKTTPPPGSTTEQIKVPHLAPSKTVHQILPGGSGAWGLS